MMTRCLSMFAVMSIAVVGCANHLQQEGPDAAAATPDASGAFTEAPHGAVPELISSGGTVLAAPKFQPIFFANDAAMQAKIEQLGAMLHGSSYWHDTTAEYGVGDITLLPTIVETAAVPTTDTALTTWLVGRLDGTHPKWGTPDQNTIYSVFLPEGAVLMSPFGNSCQAYGAYHDEMTGTHGEHIVYALMPRCVPGAIGIDDLGISTTHELAEAATDPNVATTGAFGNVDPDHYVWSIVPGAENGDFCEYIPGANARILGTFMVQRTWSNAAAKAGHDPCVPSTGTYLSAAPALDENVMMTDGPSGPQMTKGVKVAMGTPKTIEVDLFSDAAADDWKVEAIDVASDFQGGPRELSFAWDKQTGHNGDKLHLTITRTAVGQFGGSEFIVSAKGSDNMETSMWWSFAGN